MTCLACTTPGTAIHSLECLKGRNIRAEMMLGHHVTLGRYLAAYGDNPQILSDQVLRVCGMRAAKHASDLTELILTDDNGHTWGIDHATAVEMEIVLGSLVPWHSGDWDSRTGRWLRWSEVPDGSELQGLAPIGVRWNGRKVKGEAIPRKGCPRGEFAPTEAYLGTDWVPIHCR